jgi:hypothetical protein
MELPKYLSVPSRRDTPDVTKIFIASAIAKLGCEMGTSSSKKERGNMRESTSGDSGSVPSQRGPRQYSRRGGQNAQTKGDAEYESKSHRTRENKRKTHFELDTMSFLTRRLTTNT